MLGSVLVDRGKPVEARTLLLEVLPALEADGDSEMLDRALEGLVRVSEALGDRDHGAEWAARRAALR
jgi:hypothetical protein